jgi:hypothetical protein
MNNRRMFSNRIANSARFLQMPADSQLLYFHMILRADDDGVVEAYPVIKLLGTTSDAFKVLLAKRFIVQLNEDQVVVIIDWLEHNKIRADRKRDSIYKELLLNVYPEVKLIEAKERSDVKDNSKRVKTDSPRTVHGQHKLSKVKLSKVKLDNKLSKDNLATNDLIDLFKSVNPNHERLFVNITQRSAIERMVKKFGSEKMTKLINILPKTNKLQYAPSITTPVQLEQKMANLKVFLEKREEEVKNSKPIII